MSRQLCLLVILLLTLTWPTRAAESRPNILLILSDDHGWDDYSFMGHPHIQTPALDRLAAQSIVFERGYSPVPLCRPALASILTGKYPHQHGVTGNDPDLPDPSVNAMGQRGTERFGPVYDAVVERFAREPNLVRDLASRGYAAFQTGKWWEGDPLASAGFTEAMTAGRGRKARHGDAGLTIGREGVEPIKQFIRRHSDQSFFVWYAPMLPHSPHTPPPELLRKYLPLAPSEAVARYWASVEWFDQTCGELLDFLAAQGMRENTIILYTADNGWIQDPAKNNQYGPRSKRTAYEGGVRTPIMVSWPGRLQPRRDDQHLASNLDLWPTLAALLRTPLPLDLPGINLTDRREVQRRKSIWGAAFDHNIARLGSPELSLQSRWMIQGNWKLILPQGSALPELYNLESDPREKTNVAPKYPRRVRSLGEEIDEWWKVSRAPSAKSPP